MRCLIFTTHTTMKYILPFFACLFFLTPFVLVHAETRDIIFPVIGDVSYDDDFNLDSSQGRIHHGNDMLGAKMMPLVAAVDGTVRFMTWPEASYGYYVTIEDDEGYKYNYIHINNDTPGTDDGAGGGRNAYAPYIYDGATVKAGQLIGWMGDSGNAEGTTPHLHFEIRHADDEAFSPYDSLQAAAHVSVPAQADQIDDEILPFGEFAGGASIALGNMDEDEALEIVVGAGAGGGPQVRVFDQDGTAISTFFAYAEDFTGGVDVAAADMNGDGIDEIVTGIGPGKKPRVRIFRTNGEFVRGFLAYDENVDGGITVAAGDIDFDGQAEIITGTLEGAGPQVRVFTKKGGVLFSFFAYDETFRGGIDVAVREMSETKSARVVAAPLSGMKPQIKVFQADGTVIRDFLAYDEAFTGGVRLSVGVVLDGSEAPQIVTVPASNGGVDIRTYNFHGYLKESNTAFEEWWTGGFDIAAAENTLFIAAGPGGRRASVRDVAKQGSSWD